MRKMRNGAHTKAAVTRISRRYMDAAARAEEKIGGIVEDGCKYNAGAGCGA